MTDRQIAWALEHGFAEVPLDTARLLQSRRSDAAIADVVERVGVGIRRGSLGDRPHQPRPDDAASPRPNNPRSTASPPSRSVLYWDESSAKCCGRGRVERVAVTGGDTSGYVARDDRHRRAGNGRAAGARRAALRRPQPATRRSTASNSRSKADKSVTTISSARCFGGGTEVVSR